MTEASDPADRLTRLVNRLGLSTPAVFLLEANKPYYSLVSQFLNSTGSFVDPLFGWGLQELSQTLSSSAGWESLIRRIETGGEEKR